MNPMFDQHPKSQPKRVAIWLPITAVAAALLLSGCLMRQTVTENGEVVEENYIVKRPLKDAVERSQ